MAFQFQCPQGHLLEGEESQAGQAIPCPVCQMLFLIPQPVASAAPPVSHATAPRFEMPAPSVPSPAVSFASPAAPATPAEPEFLHIPCPKGHALEVPPDMLDTEVLCPQCGEQFHLQAKNSVEHKRKRAQQEAQREERANKFWLNFAIGAAICVGLLLLTLAVLTVMNQSPAARPKVPTPPANVPAPAKAAPAPPTEEKQPADANMQDTAK